MLALICLAWTASHLNLSPTERGQVTPSIGLSGGLALIFAACAGAVLGPAVKSLAATQHGLTIFTQATLVTFVVFASFGAYGLLTKRDLSIMVKGLFIGLLVLPRITLLSMFFSRFFSPYGLLIDIGGQYYWGLLTKRIKSHANRIME